MLVAVLWQGATRGRKEKNLCGFQSVLRYLLPVPDTLTVFETEGIHPWRGNRCNDIKTLFTRFAAGIKQMHLISNMKFACLQEMSKSVPESLLWLNHKPWDKF